MREQISFRARLRRERVLSLTETAGGAKSAADPLEALADLAVGLALGFMLEGTSLYRREEEADVRPSAYQSLAWKEMVGRMMDEIGSLPDREQAVLRRHYLDGLSFDQVAAMQGLSKGRVSQLHKAALQTLRKRLARAGHKFSQA